MALEKIVERNPVDSGGFHALARHFFETIVLPILLSNDPGGLK
jgi:hypothetical protein